MVIHVESNSNCLLMKFQKKFIELRMVYIFWSSYIGKYW